MSTALASSHNEQTLSGSPESASEVAEQFVGIRRDQRKE